MKKEIKVHYYFDDKDYSNEESSYIIAKFITKLAEIKKNFLIKVLSINGGREDAAAVNENWKFESY